MNWFDWLITSWIVIGIGAAVILQLALLGYVFKLAWNGLRELFNFCARRR